MILKWTQLEEIEDTDKLLLILAELTYASQRQICPITGWSYYRFHNILRKTRNQYHSNNDRNLWVKNERTRYRWDESCYSLGKEGLKYVAHVFQYPQLKEGTQGKSPHELGITDILVRLIESAKVERSHIEWFATKEASQILYRMRKTQDMNVQEKELIRPDAFLTLNGTGFWIEYDNRTEDSKKIEEKLIDYVTHLNPLSRGWLDSYKRKRKPIDQSPVIWVTTSEQRKRYLENIWKQLVNLRFYEKRVPRMLFFVRSEETEYLIGQMKKS